MIKELDLSFEPQLELARDIFLFSFYTRGMSFIGYGTLEEEQPPEWEFWDIQLKKTGNG